MINHLSIIIDPTDSSVAHRHKEHHPDKSVTQIGPEQSGNQNAEQNQHTAHGRSSVFDQMAFRAVGSNGLTKMQRPQTVDHPGSQRKPNKQCRQRCQYGT
ncbi:hypothetical protein EVA_09932 [gut metagenome]|uniref:Uncharacterized protein n=1 Tax=gut metagenome TaxID=749906 RepID=J9G400_9ZZZZ